MQPKQYTSTTKQKIITNYVYLKKYVLDNLKFLTIV